MMPNHCVPASFVGSSSYSAISSVVGDGGPNSDVPQKPSGMTSNCSSMDSRWLSSSTARPISSGNPKTSPLCGQLMSRVGCISPLIPLLSRYAAGGRAPLQRCRVARAPQIRAEACGWIFACGPIGESCDMAISTRLAALCVRISTADRGQTVENQLQRLQDAAVRLWRSISIRTSTNFRRCRKRLPRWAGRSW